MRKIKTAYELGRSQVETPPDIIRLFWKTTHKYRNSFSNVLDLGAGDGRFSLGGHYTSYEGIEIDPSKSPLDKLPDNAMISYTCAFNHVGVNYSACIGNPPYVRHHDLGKEWRDSIVDKLSTSTGERINRKSNLFVYFLFLALIKSDKDGLVSILVPYEWVSRPSAHPLRQYITKNMWHVDVYRFSQPIFDNVLTTASISVIDKKNKDGQWNYYAIDKEGSLSELAQVTGSHLKMIPHQKRGVIWAMRGMSPGTQKIFTLTEGERIHAGLRREDVLPCVTSLRDIPKHLSRLTLSSFNSRFVNAGAKCWLIKSFSDTISTRLTQYLDSIPINLRNTWTCNSRLFWYKYRLSKSPNLLVSTGFTEFGPKTIINSVGAYAVGAVCGVYSDVKVTWSDIQNYLDEFNFEKRVVSHANQLKKIEIRQLNAVLNKYWQWKNHHA